MQSWLFTLKRLFGVCALIVCLATARGLRAQALDPDPNSASAVERAMIEYACREIPAAGPGGIDGYQDCLSGQLRALRTDFGRGLQKLTTADRKAVDAACGTARASLGRQEYLACLYRELGYVLKRRNRGSSSAVAAAAPPPAPVETEGKVTVEVSTGSISPYVLAGVALVTLAAAAGGVVAFKRRRPALRQCRTCGSEVTGAGDLCAKCRHEAAATLRQANTQRAEHERAQAEEQRLQAQREEELRQRRARDKEEDARRREEDARRREEDARRRDQEESEARQRSRAAGAQDGAEQTFDPYAVLGVPGNASRDAIEAAYHEGKLRYAPEQVSHLGEELKEHYRRKAQAVEKAYQALIPGEA